MKGRRSLGAVGAADLFDDLDVVFLADYQLVYLGGYDAIDAVYQSCPEVSNRGLQQKGLI